MASVGASMVTGSPMSKNRTEIVAELTFTVSGGRGGSSRR